MQIGHTLQNNQKGDKFSPRGYRNVYALPVLKPSYKSITEQKIKFDAITTKRFGLINESVNLAHFNHQRVTGLLTTCIEKNVLSKVKITSYLQKFESGENFSNTLTELENELKHFLAVNLIECINPLKKTLESKGFDFTKDDNGTLRYDFNLPTSLNFTIDEVLQYWIVNVENMCPELQDIIIGAARLFGGMARIDTLCNAILDDEVYYSISTLKKQKKQDLYETNYDLNQTEILNTWKSIFGKKLFDEIIETFEDYYDWKISCKESASEIIEHIKSAITSVKFDDHRFFNRKLGYTFNSIPRLYGHINKYLNVSDSEKGCELVKAIKSIIKLTKKEFEQTEYKIDYTGDLNDLSGQQLMHFQGQELEEKGEERLESIGNYLMETCEAANMILNPLDENCVKAFKNIQIGWLMTTALTQLLEKYHG